MSEFYKMVPLKWDRGTDNLTLEQEAAYLRICNAIYAADQPIAENYRSLSGMWRCNERKAKRLLGELVAAGKVYVERGWIKNEKAIEDVEKRLELRVKRQLAGHSGGIESGKVRAKAAKNKDKAEASGSTRIEAEKSSVSKDTGAPADFFTKAIWTRGVAVLMDHGRSEADARGIIGRWRKKHSDHTIYGAFKAFATAGAVEPVAYLTAVLKEPSDQKLDAWGIPDAKPVRVEPRVEDRPSEEATGAADLPRVQFLQEGSEPEGPVSFGDPDRGWIGDPLPPLRALSGCLV